MHRIDRDLFVAAKQGKADEVEHLLDYGADVNNVQTDNETPLLAAVKNRHEETSIVLIDHGANVNSADKMNSTPLMYSISYTLTDVFMKLLERKCDFDVRNHDGKTPLHLAVMQGKSDYAKLLIENGADINIKDGLGRVPLCYISNSDNPNQIELASKLITGGSILDCIDNDGMTPLMLAIIDERPSIVRLLLENGCDVKLRNNQGRTPLHLAVESKKGNTVELLLKRGVTINDQDSDKATPLILAIMHQNEDGALTLINRGADLNTVDFFGWSTLMHALSNDMIVIAETLIQKGCDVNAQATKMKTGLHIVCQKHFIDSIHLLLDYGANGNIQDSNGDIPLNLYLSNIPRDKTVDMKIIKMFLKNECDLTIENKQKQSAIHFALRLGKDGLEVLKMATLRGCCSPAQLFSVSKDPRMVTVFEKYPETKRFVEENCGCTL